MATTSTTLTKSTKNKRKPLNILGILRKYYPAALFTKKGKLKRFRKR